MCGLAKVKPDMGQDCLDRANMAACWLLKLTQSSKRTLHSCCATPDLLLQAQQTGGTRCVLAATPHMPTGGGSCQAGTCTGTMMMVDHEGQGMQQS
jgi:hypothetical protein